jgi:hypothetical protein
MMVRVILLSRCIFDTIIMLRNRFFKISTTHMWKRVETIFNIPKTKMLLTVTEIITGSSGKN